MSTILPHLGRVSVTPREAHVRLVAVDGEIVGHAREVPGEDGRTRWQAADAAGRPIKGPRRTRTAAQGSVLHLMLDRRAERAAREQHPAGRHAASEDRPLLREVVEVLHAVVRCLSDRS